MDLFEKWNITLSSSSMPSDSDGETQGFTNGRNVDTTFYSNTPSSLGLMAHEFAHTIPQNVAKAESGGAYMSQPHSQRPWESDAINIAKALGNGSDICGMLTGQALGPNPVDQYYKNYDYRPFWKKVLNIK